MIANVYGKVAEHNPTIASYNGLYVNVLKLNIVHISYT